MSRARGQMFEDLALAFLQRQRMRLVARNVRSRFGEIDLVMREAEGTLVFVEVRARGGPAFGGALASVTTLKQRRIAYAAAEFLNRFPQSSSTCRFDVVAFEKGQLEWLRAAFDAATMFR